jgi:hypothetical protein
MRARIAEPTTTSHSPTGQRPDKRAFNRHNARAAVHRDLSEFCARPRPIQRPVRPEVRNQEGSRILWNLTHRTRLSRSRAANRPTDTCSAGTLGSGDSLGSAVAPGRRQIDVRSETRGGPRPHAHVATVPTRISIGSPTDSQTATRLATTASGNTAAGTCRIR